MWIAIGIGIVLALGGLFTHQTAVTTEGDVKYDAAGNEISPGPVICVVLGLLIIIGTVAYNLLPPAA
jgi:xanthine/uracil/vitamin C permease (AzgA family)